MRKLMTFAACAVLTAGMNGAVMADDGASLYASKSCNTCHGADGKTPVIPAYPKVAGQSEEYIIQQIKDIKDGKRANGMTAAMKPMVASVSDGEIKKIAKWLASQ
uniref:Cytochrome c553 n=1 Tax=Candidatus Kentrum sp. TC TaxID=2126339 RepID=A0A450ZJ15_9GAMM|nr:MAG: Cytochrome c553 [Candidatus Kentron sp. TC]